MLPLNRTFNNKGEAERTDNKSVIFFVVAVQGHQNLFKRVLSSFFLCLI